MCNYPAAPGWQFAYLRMEKFWPEEHGVAAEEATGSPQLKVSLFCTPFNK